MAGLKLDTILHPLQKILVAPVTAEDQLEEPEVELAQSTPLAGQEPD